MVLRSFGGPEVLERATVDLGPLGESEIYVRVKAVALNHLDLWVRRGLPHLKLELPHRLGSDIVGEVIEVGSAVTTLKAGDRVVIAPGKGCGACESCAQGRDNLCSRYQIFGENTQGGYAQAFRVSANLCLPFPSELSWVEAASLPLVFLTAWQMVVRKGGVRPGDTMLVHAAGSGVSSAAIQIGKLLGANVIATSRSAKKLVKAKELGADHVVDTSAADFLAECKRITGKRGVDLVIEHVGGDTFSKSVLAAKWGGRIVTCGATAGFKVDLDLRQIFFRQIELLGSTMGSRGDLYRVLELANGGRLKPVIAEVLPLWEAAKAHTLLEQGDVFGKIVLTPE